MFWLTRMVRMAATVSTDVWRCGDRRAEKAANKNNKGIVAKRLLQVEVETGSR